MSGINNTPSGIEWRYTAKKVRLGPFDSYVVVPPLILFAMHIKFWTFMLAVVAVSVMWVLELFFRLPLPEAIRVVRSSIAGERRAATPWWKIRRL